MNTPSKTVRSERERVFSPPRVRDVVPVEQQPECRRNENEYKQKEARVTSWLKRYVQYIVKPQDERKYASLMAPYNGPDPNYDDLAGWVFESATLDNCPIDELDSILADLETAILKRKKNLTMLGAAADEGHRKWCSVLEDMHISLRGASYRIELERDRRDDEGRVTPTSSEGSNTAVDASEVRSNPSSDRSSHARDGHARDDNGEELLNDNELEREDQTKGNVDSEQKEDRELKQEDLEERTLVRHDLNQADLEERTLVDEDDAEGPNRTDIQEVGETDYEEPKEHNDNQSDEGQDQQEETEEDKEQKESEAAKKKAESQRKHKQEKAKKARKRKEAADEAAKQKAKKVLRSMAIGLLLLAAYAVIIYGMSVGRY